MNVRRSKYLSTLSSIHSFIPNIYFRQSYAFVAGQRDTWFQDRRVSITLHEKEDSSKLASSVPADCSSDDSASTDEGLEVNGNHKIGNGIIGSCRQILNMIQVQGDQFKLFELDSRIGLNAGTHFESFACLFEEENNRFFVMLGDITIDKFTKSTFLNIVSFAEK